MMNWRPHTKTPERADPYYLIAFQQDDGTFALYSELYLWEDTMFRGEFTGDVPIGNYYWLAENELLATLPDQAVVNG